VELHFFCELINLGFKIDDDWNSVGSIEYDALDDFQVNFSHPFKDEEVQIGG
jgi:hypothetical protein